MELKNYYEILEIDKEATQQEIEQAYVEAKEAYSPANVALYSMFDREEANKIHQLIEEAYSVLSKHEERKRYDQKFFSGDKEALDSSKAQDYVYVKNGIVVSNYTKDSSMEGRIANLEDCSGAFLQKVRKYKGVSLADMSNFSRISKTNILAIEEEDFASLPVKVFTRGFVVQLCRLLDIDAEKFASEYTKLIDAYNKK